MKYSPTERIGVSHVEHFITKEFGWIFREQPISDMGIDAHIEIVNENLASGQLLALQIKSGNSYFKKHGDDFVYYISDEHYSYWLNHSLPVFLIIHNPENNLTLWQVVNERSVQHLEHSWKLIIPKNNLLDISAKDHFIAESPSGVYENKKIELQLHFPLLKAIDEGRKVSLITSERVHKSLNIGHIQIVIENEHGDEEFFNWPFYSTSSIENMIAKFFPWYEITIDKDFYAQNFNEPSVRYIYRILPEDIYPWIIHYGEFAEYRLQLSLSELGKSYLIVENYLYN